MDSTTLYPKPSISFSVKAYFNEEIRRFQFEGDSFQALLEKLCTLYQLSAITAAVVKYQDEDNDWITISSDTELRCAYSVASTNNNVLRVSLSIKNPVNQQEETKGIHANVLPSQELPFPCRGRHGRGRGARCGHFRGGVANVEGGFGSTPRKIMKERKKMMKNAWKHSLRIVNETYSPEGPLFVAGSNLSKTWRIRNEGAFDWNEFSLIFKKGDRMGGADRIPIEPVASGQEVDISLHLAAPNKPGKYVGVWKICGPMGRPFGQALKVKVIIPEDGENLAELEPLLEKLDQMGFKQKHRNIKLLMKHNGDVDKVVNKLIKKQQKMDVHS